MKWIKTFESANLIFTTEDKANLITFCEEHLIDLIDMGFDVDVTSKTSISLVVEISMHRSQYYYNELKDYIIPFFEAFKSEYDIEPFLDNKKKYKDISLNGNGVNIEDLENVDLTKFINDMPHLKYIKFLAKKKL